MGTRQKGVCARFDAHAHVFALCVCVSAQIFTKKILVVHYSVMSLSSKFHKDPSITDAEIFAKNFCISQSFLKETLTKIAEY